MRGSLVKQVLAGLILGAIIGVVWPAAGLKFALLGTIFVGALKSVAPIFLLSLMATIAACGASGVPGGSLLLIPMACSLFGISNEIAAQVIAIGVTISVVQDSVETGLNSSTDLVFTGAVEIAERKKVGGEPLNI